MYHTLALRTVLYGCETWEIKEGDKSRVTTVEMNIRGKRKNKHGRITGTMKIFYRILKLTQL